MPARLLPGNLTIVCDRQVIPLLNEIEYVILESAKQSILDIPAGFAIVAPFISNVVLLNLL